MRRATWRHIWSRLSSSFDGSPPSIQSVDHSVASTALSTSSLHSTSFQRKPGYFHTSDATSSLISQLRESPSLNTQLRRLISSRRSSSNSSVSNGNGSKVHAKFSNSSSSRDGSSNASVSSGSAINGWSHDKMTISRAADMLMAPPAKPKRLGYGQALPLFLPYLPQNLPPISPLNSHQVPPIFPHKTPLILPPPPISTATVTTTAETTTMITT
ncbi:unnamed protein product [Closterium sp. NIES-54]